MTRVVLLFVLLLGACVIDDKSNPEGEGGSDFSGSDNGSDAIDDDAGSDTLPTYPVAHPRIYVEANKARLQASLAANTDAAARFRDMMDRWVGGYDIWGFQIWNAALLGQLTGDAKYCVKSVAAVDAMVATDEAAISSGAQPEVAKDSYLKVGDIVGDVALVYDWCFDVTSASQKSRWLAYANQAVWNVWHPTQAKWGSTSMPWSGWSVNNPSNNYYYSFLRATMLLGLATKGETPEGDTWIAQFRDAKVLGELVPTFDAQLAGGSSREGTAYGVSMRMLWQLYDIWMATTGEKLQSKTHHARQSMRAFVNQVVPTLDRFAPTGDQPRDSTAMFFDYQRQYLQELIQLYPHDAVAPRAKALLAASTVPRQMRPEMLVYDFLYDNSDVAEVSLDGFAKQYYAPGIGELYMRSGWERDATWVNLIAGPYTESHAHQDQGSLMLYKDGWLGYDGVIDSSNGIIQETGSHSLVRIDSGGTPIRQVVNTQSQLVSLHRGDDWMYAAADLTPAYGGNAAISKVQRELVYLEPNAIIVYDRVASSGSTTQTWQLATPVAPSVSGTVATISGAHQLRVQRLAPASATSAAYNLASTSSYKAGYRLDTRVSGGDVRYLHALSIDGAITSATGSGDSVTVTLSSGETATVSFAHDSIGATLTYHGVTTTLAAGLDTLPE